MSSRLARVPLLVGLPLLTMLLGWQLGVRYEQEKLEGFRQQLDVLYGTGSGTVVTDPEHQVDPSILWGVWRLLLQYYIEPGDLKAQQLLYGAVGGLVQAIGDPYTVFMTPPQNTEFRDALQGKLQGIGAELTMQGGFAVIVSPLKGSPAERAGLRPDDVILEVDHISMEGKNLQEIVTAIRGPKGTDVTIQIARAIVTEPISLTITRDDITVPSVESRVIAGTGGKLGYIALNQFGEQSLKEIRAALSSFEKESIRGIILDLRGNGGGYLDAAVDLASIFLREGKVVSVEGRQGIVDSKSVSGRPLYPEIPLTILINKGSASASEIVAGALQDHGRATIVGETSFGKGTVQEVIDLPDGSSLRVTVAHWLTPKGKNLGKEGVHPDIDVKRTAEQFEANQDPQLDAAVEFLLTGKKPVSSSSASSK